MSGGAKVKWIGFDELLFKLGGAPMEEILGDGDAALHAARHVMFLFLKHGDWIARTTSPESFEFKHGEDSIPLNSGNMIEPIFWRYFENADATGVPYEALARGGPWAHWQYERDGFEFGLAGDHNGKIVGRAHGVQIWVRTGKFSGPGRGRKEGSKGRGDPKGYNAAVARIVADINRAETLQEKLDARAAGVIRESFVVRASTPQSAQTYMRSRLVKVGYGEEDLKRRF